MKESRSTKGRIERAKDRRIMKARLVERKLFEKPDPLNLATDAFNANRGINDGTNDHGRGVNENEKNL